MAGLFGSSLLAGLPLTSIVGSSTTNTAATTSTTSTAGLFGLAAGLPLVSGLPLLLENISPPFLNVSQFNQTFGALRFARSDGLVQVKPNADLTDFDFTNVNSVLRVGSTISLLTSLPEPGQLISLLTLTNATVKPASSSASTSSSTSSSSAGLHDLTSILTASVLPSLPTTLVPSIGVSVSVSVNAAGPSSSTTTSISTTASAVKSGSNSVGGGTIVASVVGNIVSILPRDASTSAAPDPVPSQIANNTVYTIPGAASIASKWLFFKKDPSDSAFVPANASTSSSDTFGQYQILNGSLLSTLSSSAAEVVFFPAPSTTGDQRKVVACMIAEIFVPHGVHTQSIVAPPFCLGGVVDSWTSIFGNISNNVITQDPNNAAFPFTMKDLFHINVDTNAPVAGAPVTLQVLPVDKASLLAPRVDSILDVTPDLKVQAALDIGAPLTSFIQAGVKAVTSLFSPSSGASTANKVGNGVLTVANVLDGLLTIPIALDFKGRQLTKTLKPLIGDDVLPSISQLPGLPGLAGALPIGALTATIKSAAENITIVPSPADTIMLHDVSDALHGLSLRFLPQLLQPDSVTPKTVNLEIGIAPSIQLPGFPQPLTYNISIGSISVTLPTITVPQLAMFFHDINYVTSSGPDILVAVDPVSSRFLSTAVSLNNFLVEFTQILSNVRQIFPPSVIPDPALSRNIDDLLSMASSILRFVQGQGQNNAPTLTFFDPSLPGMQGLDLTDTHITDFHGAPAGVSSLLYMGLADISAQSAQLMMDVVDGNTAYTLLFNGGVTGYLAQAAHDPPAIFSSNLQYTPTHSGDQPASYSSYTKIDFDNSMTKIYFGVFGKTPQTTGS